MTAETSTQQPQSFWQAAPLPEIERDEPFNLNAMIGHYCAMYIAHAEAYHRAVRAESRALDAGADRDAAGAALRAAIVEHLQPAVAAWTAAALLKGWTPQEIHENWDWQVVDELACQWLGETTDLTGEQIRALTTVPVKGEDGLY